jgi:hypothetical protein
MRSRHERVRATCRSESIPKRAGIGKHNCLGRVCDDLGRLSVWDGLRRVHVVGWNYCGFLSHCCVGKRISADGSGIRTGVGVRLRSDLLIVVLRRWRQLLVPLSCPLPVCGVIHSAGARISRFKYASVSRDGGHRPFLHFCSGARFVGWETGIYQPGHGPDKNAELNRNKICNLQLHFSRPLPVTITV